MIFELLFIFIMLEITGRNFMSKIKRLDETKEIQLFEMKFRSGFLFLTILVLACFCRYILCIFAFLLLPAKYDRGENGREDH